MDTICAFSSDSRELYKADIYRVLALPKNHIIHFRYKTKYVDDNLLSKPEKLIDRKVAIFFTHGNTCVNPNENTFQHFSVRWATITSAKISKVTDVFHVYMKLDEFCNVEIDSGNSIEKRPPTKFFSELSYTEKTEGSTWHSRIMAINDYFPAITFFHLKGIQRKGKEVPLKHQNNKTCSYNLYHGDRYTVKLAVSNPKSSATKIEISDSSGEVTINCINPFESSIQFDDHDIPISVKNLQVITQASLLEFKPTRKNTESGKDEVLGEYSTNIEINLKLNFKKPLIFGFFSTLAFCSFLLARPESSTTVPPSVYELFFSTLLFYISSSSLFFWFNKK